MSNYKENHSQTPDFDVVPAGTYSVQVEESSIGDGKDPAKPKVWTIKLCIIGGKFANRYLWFRLSMGDTSAGFRKGSLTALGLDTKANVSYDLIEDVIGRKAMAEVTIDDTFDGTPRNKVRRLRSLTSIDGSKLGQGIEDNPFK